MLQIFIDIFAVIGSLILTVIGASVVEGRLLKPIIIGLGVLTILAAVYGAYDDQSNRSFIDSKITGDKSRCIVEAQRSAIMPPDNFLLWAVNKGVPAISNTVIAMHAPDGIHYVWSVPMAEPCTAQEKAINEIGLGTFHLEIDDTPGATSFEALTIEKQGDKFHQKITISGKWSFEQENDF